MVRWRQLARVKRMLSKLLSYNKKPNNKHRASTQEASIYFKFILFIYIILNSLSRVFIVFLHITVSYLLNSTAYVFRVIGGRQFVKLSTTSIRA